MRIPSHPTLIRRMRDARVRQFVAHGPPLAASLGRQKGGWHVTLKVGGKTRTVFVPKALRKEVERSILEHRRLKRLLREITLLQLALIRGHRRWAARRGARR